MNIIKFKNKIPSINETSRLFLNSCLIGDVRVKEEASIWFGSILRGDIYPIIIGSRSNIRDFCLLHGSNGIIKIGDGVSIGQRSVLDSCVIEDSCMIGANCVLMDGVLVGENSIVLPNSLLLKNRKFPPFSLVHGSPARVVRPLIKSELEKIKEESNFYVDLKNSYSKVCI